MRRTAVRPGQNHRLIRMAGLFVLTGLLILLLPAVLDHPVLAPALAGLRPLGWMALTLGAGTLLVCLLERAARRSQAPALQADEPLPFLTDPAEPSAVAPPATPGQTPGL
jgi:hypothetical protein